MIEKKSNKDTSKKTIRKGIKKNKFNSNRAGVDVAPEFKLNTGWPTKGYKKDGKRVKTTNPSHEGEEWFDSKSFNDSETNKRPIHPQKDYLNKHDDHTGDDYIEMGHEKLEDKVKYSENPNLDQENYKKGGHLKIDRDGWSGNDHLKVKTEKPKKGDDVIVGYAPELKYNLDKKPDIYKVNENIENMKAINEQTNRIKQMMGFKDGMTLKDVQKLTEAHDKGGFAAATPTDTAYAVGDSKGNMLTTTWAHNMGKDMAPSAENIYATVHGPQDKKGIAKQVMPGGGKLGSKEGQWYLTSQLGGKDDGTTALYRGVTGKKGVSYSSPVEGEYGATLGPDGKVFSVGEKGGHYVTDSLQDQPWFWGSHERGTRDSRSVPYDAYSTESGYLDASDLAKPWQSRQRKGQAPKKSTRRGVDSVKGPGLGIRAKNYSTEDAYDTAIKQALSSAQNNPTAGRSRKGGTGAGAAGSFEAPVMNPATGKASKKSKKLSENTMRKRIKENNDMSFWGGKRPIQETKRTKKVRLTESQLISVIEKTVEDHLQERALGVGFTHQTNGFSNPVATRQQEMSEDKDWMGGVEKDIEKRGTEGVFHEWCDKRGYDGGCDAKCWDAAKKEGGIWSKRAGLAKAFCESRK